MNYLKLEVGKEYNFEFLSREKKDVGTPFGKRYVYRIKSEGKETELRATDKLRMVIEFYFKTHKSNKVNLSVFNGGNYNTTITEYLIISK